MHLKGHPHRSHCHLPAQRRQPLTDCVAPPSLFSITCSARGPMRPTIRRHRSPLPTTSPSQLLLHAPHPPKTAAGQRYGFESTLLRNVAACWLNLCGKVISKIYCHTATGAHLRRQILPHARGARVRERGVLPQYCSKAGVNVRGNMLMSRAGRHPNIGYFRKWAREEVRGAGLLIYC